MARVFCVALVLLLGGCSLNPFEFFYAPPGSPASVEGPPVVGVDAVIDQRGVPPRELGVYRDAGQGRAAKLTVDQQVSYLVGDVFRESLAARSLLADESPRYLLTVNLLRFGCDQVPDERAFAKFHFVLKDATGHSVYAGDEQVEVVAGEVLSLDTGEEAKPEDLRRLAGRVLRQAVDDALDNRAFRSALAAQP